MSLRDKFMTCRMKSLLLSSSSQLLAELARLPLPGLEGGLGVQQLVQLPADVRHVELRGLALLPEGRRLHPELHGGHGELLAALTALQLHPLGVVEERLHAHGHRLTLIARHVLEGGMVQDEDGGLDKTETESVNVKLKAGL